RPATAAEQADLAEVCRFSRRHVASVTFATAAFAASPALANDLEAGHRYYAAYSAALAGCGQGRDAGKLDDKESARFRQPALTWLRADLALRRRQAASARGADRAEAQRALRYWQSDPNLACVRDKEGLAKLPEAERNAWLELWADVRALCRRAEA